MDVSDARSRAASPGWVVSLLPWLMLAATLAITWVVWDHEHQVANRNARAQFDFALRETVSRVEQRVVAYEQMLRGVQGLMATTGLSQRRAFHDYIETLEVDANFTGIQAVGIVEAVPAERVQAHLAAMRRAQVKDYDLRPAGARAFYAPIVQREPYVGRNQAPPGLDVWADPVRRAALERARDSGLPSITGKLQLAIDAGADAPPAFVMYLPVFEPGQAHGDLMQRREHLIGWVYAAFHVSDFMAGLYGKLSPGMTLAMYDSANPTPATLLYRSDAELLSPTSHALPVWQATEYMVVAGHTWTLNLSTNDDFAGHQRRDVPMLIAATGVGLALALGLLAWLLVHGRARVVQLAEVMTEELRHIAQHDPLTRLANRLLFSDRLNHELKYAKRQNRHFGLLFLDLDDFKLVNDSLGHAVGDRLLQKVAERLVSCVRETDTVGRMGGDEFVVLVSALSQVEAVAHLAEKIRQCMSEPFLVDGHQLSISCSLGVAVYPDDGTDAISLAKSADEAMYRAKVSGRNTVRFAHDMDEVQQELPLSAASA